MLNYTELNLPCEEGEQWIEAYPDYYLSNLGRWFSNHSKRIIKQFPNDSGYMRATITVDGERKHVFTHIKVVEFFGDKNGQTIKHLNSLVENKLSIDHLDSNKENNAFHNLELVTHKENCIRRDLRRINFQKEKESEITWYILTVKRPKEIRTICRTDKEAFDGVVLMYKKSYPKATCTTATLKRLPYLKASSALDKKRKFTLIIDYREEAVDLITCEEKATLDDMENKFSYLWPDASMSVEFASVML